MNILTPRIHGYLDYLTVAFFLIAPSLFGLTGTPAVLAYVLAGVHLLMTVCTAFPLGLVDVLPFRLHGTVELVVAVALIVLPWVLSGVFAGAQVLYTVVGGVILVVWLLTDYRASGTARAAGAAGRAT